MPGKGKIAFFAILQKTQEIKGIIRTDDFLNKIEVFRFFGFFQKIVKISTIVEKSSKKSLITIF
jgi:hypothetical protein